MNKVILLGNLTRDVELKTIPSGSIVGNVGIATNESYTNKQGEKVDKVSFHNLTVWNKQAETLAKYTQKGSKLLVEGKLDYQEWEKDGVKRIMTKIIVDRFEFAGSKQTNQNQNNQNQTQNNQNYNNQNQNQNCNNNQNNNAPAMNNSPVNNEPVNNNQPNNNQGPNGEEEIRIEDIPF